MRTLKALVVTSLLALPLVASAAPPTKAPATGDTHVAKATKVHHPRMIKKDKKAPVKLTPAPATPAPATPAPTK